VITTTDKVRLIRSAFGSGTIDGRGVNIAVECPSCGKTGKRKLSIHLETGQCHCWVCGMRSKRVSSVLFKHVSREAAEEYRRVCEGGVALDDKTGEEEKVEDRVSLPEDFRPIFSRSTTGDTDARQAVRYLMQRGLSTDDIVRFRLGTASSVRRRVIIPSFNSEGALNFYTARSIDPDINLRYANAQVKKTDIIFNEINIDWSREIVLVEGPFDLIKCPDNATCLLGSSLGTGHQLFHKIAANRTPVVLALDADMRSKTQKIAELLYSYDCNVRILDISSRAKDIGDLTHAEAVESIKQAQQWRPMDRLLFTISNIRSGSSL